MPSVHTICYIYLLFNKVAVLFTYPLTQRKKKKKTEAEAPILSPPDMNSLLSGKDPDAEKNRRRRG